MNVTTDKKLFSELFKSYNTFFKTSIKLALIEIPVDHIQNVYQRNHSGQYKKHNNSSNNSKNQKHRN